MYPDLEHIVYFLQIYIALHAWLYATVHDINGPGVCSGNTRIHNVGGQGCLCYEFLGIACWWDKELSAERQLNCGTNFPCLRSMLKLCQNLTGPSRPICYRKPWRYFNCLYCIIQSCHVYTYSYNACFKHIITQSCNCVSEVRLDGYLNNISMSQYHTPGINV